MHSFTFDNFIVKYLNQGINFVVIVTYYFATSNLITSNLFTSTSNSLPIIIISLWSLKVVFVIKR